MLADIPAVAYTASWSDFFNAEFTANFEIDFFTSSKHRVACRVCEVGDQYRTLPPKDHGVASMKEENRAHNQHGQKGKHAADG
jgi:hypothetical protein